MRLIALLLTTLLALFSTNTQAMTLETQGNLLFATGPVVDDLAKFEAAFAQKSIDTVVFVNSPGGDLWNGIRIGRLIASKGYNTIAAGSCVSACSIMFIAGKERRFSDAFRPNQTYIGIHGAHNKNTREINTTVQSSIYAFFKLHMDDKFNHSVMNQALNEMDDAGSLLRVFESTRNPKVVSYHCKSGQSLRKDCTDIKGQDAMSLGIITHADLVKLNLPTAFKPANTVLGQELSQVLPELATYLSDLAGRQCSTDTCKTDITKFPERPENRSLATVIEGKGLGLAWGSDNPYTALLRAVYFCNHPKDKPARLCEAEIINSYDVRPIYRAAEAAHKAALAKLQVPTAKFYADEEYGGGFTSASSLRTERFQDITPQKLDAIPVIGTQALAQAMLESAPPIIVDVNGANISIPGASTLIYGGHAVADTAQDAAFEKRFESLLKLLVPQPDTRVVFYCAGRECWQSVNAALRAKKLGYTQVSWYRGGLISWISAGLPTAPNVVRAVAQ
jgi:rhodanese-related sulfurtransferase